MITLDAQLEAMIAQGLIDPSTGQPVIEPDLARTMGERVAAIVGERQAQFGASAPAPALIVQPRLRRALATLLRLRAPGCAVLSISELPETQPIEVIEVIGGELPPPPSLPGPGAQSHALESMAA